MNPNKKLLHEDYGYSLVELTIIIAVLGITMVTIYSLVVSGAKIQKSSEETYEATLQSQSLLQNVNNRIEKDLTDKIIKDRKGDNYKNIEVKPWLKSEPYDQSIINFLHGKELDIEDENDEKKINAFRDKFNTDTFLYEVHIWELDEGGLKLDDAGEIKLPTSFVEYNDKVEVPDFDGDNTAEFTMVEINQAIKEYYGSKDDPLLWLKPETPGDLKDTDIKAIGEITCKEEVNKKDEIQIRGNGIVKAIDGMDEVKEIKGYGDISAVVKLSYENYEDSSGLTHKLIIEDKDNISASNKLKDSDVIQLGVDLTTFVPGSEGNSNAPKTRVIRIENKTKAKVVIPVFNENKSEIKIFPIQHKAENEADKDKNGRIVIQEKERKNPSKNFVVGIIVRDAYNSTFGEDNKILSKLVDVYSYDYNKQ